MCSSDLEEGVAIHTLGSEQLIGLRPTSNQRKAQDKIQPALIPSRLYHVDSEGDLDNDGENKKRHMRAVNVTRNFRAVQHRL